MYLYHNTKNEPIIDVTSIYQQNEMIQKMKRQFASFGYQEVRTPAFQPYDLYVQMNGTVNQQEMIKTIDNSGNVLVLRPDVTIPLTQRIAMSHPQLNQELRYFYILDVFRQYAGTDGRQENTQIGAEYFGNQTAAADAEIIALSMNVLQSIDLEKVKIELGHAGFFKELIAEMKLDNQTLKELKQSIRAKNVPEIETILQHLKMDDALKEIITSLPFLYGKPEQVLKQAKALPLTDAMHETLDNIAAICDYLDAYGLGKHIVTDLSLINHMDYYSDIIFQGFIEKAGKPVLMGGRYNTLAKQFGAHIPAIGFACNLDLLLEHADNRDDTKSSSIDAIILYTPETTKPAISLANHLRQFDYRTIAHQKKDNAIEASDAKAIIHVEAEAFVLERNEANSHFTSETELMTFLQKEE